MATTKIVVNIPGEEPYDVRVGEGLLTSLGEHLMAIPELANRPDLVVITDSNVAPLYCSSVKNSLTRAGYKVSDISVGAGEASKSVEVASELWEAMAMLGLGRDCAVVALGGGVVGDLAGFVASTFMRGVPVVQVPTTLLSMVDSSVGGKTGINLAAGKNLIGAFMQPSYVCASLDTLSTLPEREWKCGCGEIAKSAVIDSDDFFFWLMDSATQIRNRQMDVGVIQEAITRCITFKAGVVAADKTETKGVRECLNYGHTLAHAIETLAGYGTYSHGAAVAEGMRFAAFLSERTIGASAAFVQAQASLLDDLGLEKLDWSAPVDRIMDSMKHDKKVRAGQLRFVLVRDVADWVVEDLSDDVVADALSAYYQ